MWPEFNRKVTRVPQVQKQIENSLETILQIIVQKSNYNNKYTACFRLIL